MQLDFSPCNLHFCIIKKRNFKVSLKETACISSFVLNCDFITHQMSLKGLFSSNPDQQSKMNQYFYATCETDSLIFFTFFCSLVVAVYMPLEQMLQFKNC